MYPPLKKVWIDFLGGGYIYTYLTVCLKFFFASRLGILNCQYMIK